MNKRWHEQHVLGPHARLDERVTWHLAHAEVCACRPVPAPIAAEIKDRGLVLPSATGRGSSMADHAHDDLPG